MKSLTTLILTVLIVTSAVCEEKKGKCVGTNIKWRYVTIDCTERLYAVYFVEREYLYQFNDEVIDIHAKSNYNNQKRFGKPVRGEYGLIAFVIRKHIRKTLLNENQVIAECNNGKDDSFLACVEDYRNNIDKHKKSHSGYKMFIACAVCVGTMRFQGARIPVLRLLPKVTMKQFITFMMIENGKGKPVDIQITNPPKLPKNKN